MSTEPYASAKRVFWVVDNGSPHNGQASIDRMNTAWPTAELVNLPVHASWLDQVVRHEAASDDDTVLSRAEAVLVTFDLKAHKARSLSPPERERLLEVLES